MPFIKLHRGNDTGESVGRVLVNPEQIIAISAGQMRRSYRSRMGERFG